MDGRNVDEVEEARGSLILAGCDAAKLDRASHHALSMVASGVSNPVQRVGQFAFEFLRDDRVRALRTPLGPQVAVIVAFFTLARLNRDR